MTSTSDQPLTPDDGQLLAPAIVAFGQDLVRYVLAVSDKGRPLSDVPLTEQQLTVLAQLAELGAAVLTQHPALAQFQAAINMAQPVGGSSTSPIIALRWQAGATPTMPPSDDPVATTLLQLAQDFYAAYLIPMPEEIIQRYTPGPISFAHPANVEFCRRVLADEDLAKLFPDSPLPEALDDLDSINSISSMLVTTSGKQFGLQLSGLADCVLATAFSRCLLYNDIGPEAYFRAIMETLGTMRRLAVGRQAEVEFIIGLANISLSGGAPLELPYGHMRPPRTYDRRFLGHMSGSTQAVFVGRQPIKILSCRSARSRSAEAMVADFQGYLDTFEDWNRNLQRTADTLLYGLILGSPDDQVIGAQITTMALLDPLWAQPDVRLRQHSIISPFGNVTLGAETADMIKLWAAKIDSQHPKTLDVAMRRMISATTRSSPIDGFVDAVIAWENMFSGTPETALRVCGAMAWLLEPDSYQQRSTMYGELSKMYLLRSNLVHGKGQEPQTSEAEQKRKRSLGLAIRVMRALYKFPDILAAPDAPARGKAVLLGAAGEVVVTNDDEPAPGSSR